MSALADTRQPETVHGGWRDLAACRGMPTDFFYPEGRGHILWEAEQQAKQICLECPVRRQCLDYARQRPERYGVFGGLSQTERGWGRR